MPDAPKTHTRFLPSNSIRPLSAVGRTFEARSLFTIDPTVKKWLVSRIAILEKWRLLGGPASPVGLPLDSAFPMIEVNEGVQVNFRGGVLRVMDKMPGLVEVVPRRVVVTFEGYGLEIRQEKGDELYGTLACKVGSTGYSQSFDLLQVELGPEDNNRVHQSSIVLWDGPPADLNIVASLAEHDDGDREAVRQRMRQRLGDLFKFGAAAVAGGVSAGQESLTAQSSYAAESSSTNALVGWLVGGAADLITDVFGLGDDPYNPAALTNTAAEMMQVPPVQTYTCYSDPRTIAFTHSRTITGTDDGGDVGQVTMLFRVRTIA